MAFMERHGLQTTNDLAQVFRVWQSTASRWLKESKKKPLSDVMPGPALILLELMEQGVETPDLTAARSMAAIHAQPQAIDEIPRETDYRIEIPEKARYGARLVAPTGHFIVVHSRWFKDRSARLAKLAEAAKGARRARLSALVQRYQDAVEDMAALPR